MTDSPATDLGLSEEERELIGVLRALLAQRGPSLLANRRRLLGLLRDHAPERARAIRLLMTAYDAGAPERLRSLGAADGETLASEARSLSADSGLREDLARSSVGVWATALSSAPLGPVHSVPPPPPLAPPRAADDLTWSTPAPPPNAPPPAAPSLAPPPVPPVAAAVVPPPNPVADDLTWSTPTAPASPPPPMSPAPVAAAASAAPARSLKSRDDIMEARRRAILEDRRTYVAPLKPTSQWLDAGAAGAETLAEFIRSRCEISLEVTG